MAAEIDSHVICKCVNNILSGRCMVACKDIKCGQLVFREVAYAISPNCFGEKRFKICIHCCRRAISPFSTCVYCKHVYCSEACFEIHHTNHKIYNECAALQFVHHMHNCIQPEDYDTFQMICIILARRQYELNRNILTEYVNNKGRESCCTTEAYIKEEEEFVQSEVETVANITHICECVRFSDKSEDHSCGDSTKESTYENVKSLITNVSKIDRDILADFVKLYEQYLKKVSKWNKRQLSTILSFRSDADKNVSLPNEISKSTFVSLCAAFLCNGFGMWDESGKLLASMLYPQCSFFNHNCAPNIGRCNTPHSRIMEFYALKDICEGEELCISYVDVKLPAHERQKRLFATYSFNCQCLRCRPEATFEVANTVCEVSGVPPLCSSCACKFLLPVEPNVRRCLWCNELYYDEIYQCRPKKYYFLVWYNGIDCKLQS